MTVPTQKAQAELFRRLHQGPDVLLVGSAWDPGSAIIFEQAGFRAIATSSAGVAFSLGYPDGERLPSKAMLAAVGRIVDVTQVPISVDIEGGYGATPEAVAHTCRGVLEVGAVGVNIEDGMESGRLVDSQLQAEKIRAVRAMANEFGVPLVINARTDCYWLELETPSQRFADTVRRANLYRDAGADCLFVPGVKDPATIGDLTREIDGPLNILATAGGPSVSELAALGVRRVSQGSGPARAVLALTQRIAEELLANGTYTAYTDATVTYAEANALFRHVKDL